jgi:hypothetical protein
MAESSKWSPRPCPQALGFFGCAIRTAFGGRCPNRLRPNKRMEPTGAIVLKEAGRLCSGARLFTFKNSVRRGRVARGSCAIR